MRSLLKIFFQKEDKESVIGEQQNIEVKKNEETYQMWMEKATLENVFRMVS